MKAEFAEWEQVMEELEARAGIEPTHRVFADLPRQFARSC